MRGADDPSSTNGGASSSASASSRSRNELSDHLLESMFGRRENTRTIEDLEEIMLLEVIADGSGLSLLRI